MNAGRKVPPILLAVIAVIGGLSCGRTAGGGATATSPPPSTPTPIPTPIPPVNTPGALPTDSDLRALIEYANAMQPILIEAGAILQRDGPILKASEEDDSVLCDGRLAADNEAMKGILDQTRAIAPPSDARAIHELMLRSGDAWTEALDNVERFCDTGNPLYKVSAVFKFWEAALAIQDAGNRFWMLIMAEGVEDWVRR